jgi:UDP-N-acetylglucosamine diphosphorylase/glucosamine-1-phosphate N-acetyltransferase
VSFVCRDYLSAVYQQETVAKVNDLTGLESALFINGRTLAAFSELPPIEGESEIGLQDGFVVYARLKADEMAGLADSPEDLADKLAALDVPKKEVQGVQLVSYLWELIKLNEEEPNAIAADFEFYADPKKSQGIIEKGAYVRVEDGDEVKVYDAEEAMKLVKAGELPLYLGEGARVKPNVLLDLSDGPIYIGAHADVRPPTIIDGPCCLMDSAGTSKKTTVIDGAKLRPGITLGPVCRIGGEVEATIVQGYTNKHHSGFIGHAYLGEWVNVGAMATNSDLKNDLTDVSVYANGKPVDTGDLKVGSFIGDHTKLGIGALLTTGTVVGIMTNVLSSGVIPPKFVPSFCVYREDRIGRGFRLKALIETAERVMGRRRVDMTPEYAEMLGKLSEMLKDERDAEMDKHNRKADTTILKVVRQWAKSQD